MGRSKKDVFSWLRERLWQKTQGFGEKHLSKAGKEVMIKAVLQAIPTYVMGCFKLPEYLIRELESIISNFWWGDGTNKKIHWVKWDILCESKRDGGLGFRDLSSFNMAMLGKQIWRVIQNPDSLLSRIWKAKYFPDCDVLDSQLKQNASYTWKSIHGAISLVKEGILWRIGNGVDVDVWKDNWIPRESCRHPRTPDMLPFGELAVSNFITDDGRCWDREAVEAVFWPEDVDSILRIPLGGPDCVDVRRWFFTQSGYYSVSSAYYLARKIKSSGREVSRAGPSNLPDSRSWNFVWGINTPNKIKVFLWRLVRNALPVTVSLSRRNINVDLACPMCDNGDESVLHIFCSCSFARIVWAMSGLPSHVILRQFTDIWEWICFVKQELCTTDFRIFVVSCWCIWFHRNRKVHEGIPGDPQDLRMFVHSYINRFDAAKASFATTYPTAPTVTWAPPSAPFVKVNVDAGFNLQTGNAGIGIVARNWHGTVLYWQHKQISHVASAEVSEILAVQSGLAAAMQQAWTHVWLESDCKRVIDALHSMSPDLSIAGHLVEAIRVMARSFVYIG